MRLYWPITMNKTLITPPQAVYLQAMLEALSELLVIDTLEANRIILQRVVFWEVLKCFKSHYIQQLQQ